MKGYRCDDCNPGCILICKEEVQPPKLCPWGHNRDQDEQGATWKGETE